MESLKIRSGGGDEIEDAARVVHNGPTASGNVARRVAHRERDAGHGSRLEIYDYGSDGLINVQRI